tara:strand:- start:299 stop:565 length:267 start_codon:yes stop_codon:yes gene_type:complete
MDQTQTFNLDDTTIAQIAKCLQVAILTGTDIADNLRQLQLEIKDNNKVGVTDNYLSTFQDNIERMLGEASKPFTSTQNEEAEQLKLFE